MTMGNIVTTQSKTIFMEKKVYVDKIIGILWNGKKRSELKKNILHNFFGPTDVCTTLVVK